MTSQQQTAYQHPCRHPMEMAHPRYQGIQILDRVRYSTTVTINWGGGIFPRQPVWHAQVTVVGPQESRRLQGLSASVRQQARQLAGQALVSVGMKTQHVLETDVGVHVYAPLTEQECAGLPTPWLEAVQRMSPHNRTEVTDGLADAQG
jgi:hypothetical protein